MRKVAEAFALTTSTVSQQIAALAREAGEQLIEPDGRRVRLTPAGQRLAEHAVTILAAVDAARSTSIRMPNRSAPYASAALQPGFASRCCLSSANWQSSIRRSR
jgi:DNA-binding transcriptional LysR family regulator